MGAGDDLSLRTTSFGTLITVLLWVTSNVGTLFLNKVVLTEYKFDKPIILTAIHMAASWLLCHVSIVWLQVVPRARLHDHTQTISVCMLAVVFCGSVVAGNASLKYIPVSVNQTIGSCTPAFTALFSFLLTGSRESLRTYLSLLPIIGGTALAAGVRLHPFEPSFNAFGLSCIIIACALRALKTVLQDVMLKDGSKLDSLNLLSYMAPVALAVLLPLAVYKERDGPLLFISIANKRPSFILVMSVNGVVVRNKECCNIEKVPSDDSNECDEAMHEGAGPPPSSSTPAALFEAFLQNLSNFLVTKATSALTLQILGKTKGIGAVVLALLIYRNPVSVSGMAGYGICIVGVGMFSDARAKSNFAEKERRELREMREAAGLGASPAHGREVSPLRGTYTLGDEKERDDDDDGGGRSLSGGSDDCDVAMEEVPEGGLGATPGYPKAQKRGGSDDDSDGVGVGRSEDGGGDRSYRGSPGVIVYDEFRAPGQALRSPVQDARKGLGGTRKRILRWLQEEGWWVVPLAVLIAIAVADSPWNGAQVVGSVPVKPWARSILVPEPSACDLARFAETCAIPCTASLLAEAEAAVAGAEERTLFITWADQFFMEMLLTRWVPHLELQRIGRPNMTAPANASGVPSSRRAGILVIAGDDESAAVVRAADIPVVPMGHLPPGTANLTCQSGSHSTGDCLRRYHFIAFTKLAVPRCLTAHGISVVALDTDAAVTGDLLNLLNEANADVATILDDQRSLSQLVPLEHFYGLDPRIHLTEAKIVIPKDGHSFSYAQGPLMTGLGTDLESVPELMRDESLGAAEGGATSRRRRALQGVRHGGSGPAGASWGTAAGGVGGMGRDSGAAGAAWGGVLGSGAGPRARSRAGAGAGAGAGHFSSGGDTAAGGVGGGRHLLKKKHTRPAGTPGIDLPLQQVTPSPVTDVMAWGLPWSPDDLGPEAIGGPGARLGQCLGVAFFRAGTAWADGRQLPPWAGYLERTLIQKSFAWGLANWIVDSGHADLFEVLKRKSNNARQACSAQSVTFPGSRAVPELTVAFLPYDGSGPDPEPVRRWCLAVNCRNASWVRHCFGTIAEKMECTGRDLVLPPATPPASGSDLAVLGFPPPPP